ncbi:hypothetical protein RJ639_001991, partial [Escallonia herrerae]
MEGSSGAVIVGELQWKRNVRSADPWKGHVITSNQSSQFHSIKGGDLQSKSEFITNMHSGDNPNFNSVLSDATVAVRLFVFSDIKFDQASANWETDCQAIKREFSERGYENVPEIMFWNPRHSSATHGTATQNGVALLSGYSKNLLTLFLEEDGVINPKDLAKQSKPE